MTSQARGQLLPLCRTVTTLPIICPALRRFVCRQITVITWLINRRAGVVASMTGPEKRDHLTFVRSLYNEMWPTIDLQQTKEPYALSNVGWRVDP